MFGQLTSALDRIYPDSEPVHRKSVPRQHRGTPERIFSRGDTVFVRNFLSTGERWLLATVCLSSGPVSYVILLKDGTKRRKRVDHLCLLTLDMPNFASANASEPQTEVLTISALVEENVSNGEVTPSA